MATRTRIRIMLVEIIEERDSVPPSVRGSSEAPKSVRPGEAKPVLAKGHAELVLEGQRRAS